MAGRRPLSTEPWPAHIPRVFPAICRLLEGRTEVTFDTASQSYLALLLLGADLLRALPNIGFH